MGRGRVHDRRNWGRAGLVSWVYGARAFVYEPLLDTEGKEGRQRVRVCVICACRCRESALLTESWRLERDVLQNGKGGQQRGRKWTKGSRRFVIFYIKRDGEYTDMAGFESKSQCFARA